MSINTWFKAENILNDFGIYALNRGNISIKNIIEKSELLKKYSKKIITIDLNFSYKFIPSTIVRDCIKNNNTDKLRNYIDNETLSYIKNNNLYSN